MSTPLISFDRVHKTFPPTKGGKAVHAVDDVTLDIQAGEIFGVIGFSGAGKSTLVRLINGLEPTTSGRLVVDGHEVSALDESRLRAVRPEIGMIFQQFNLFSSKTIEENVAYPLRLAKADKAARAARVAQLLDFVGLADKAKSYPAQLSGGQKQRVGIARALATEPKILLADECTSALDPHTTREVLDLLRTANQELGITIVIITHEMDVVRYLCDRVAIMENGKVVEVGGVYDIFSSPQAEVTRRFVHTALQDRPSADVLGRLARSHPGRIVTMRVSDDGAAAADRFATFTEHGVSAQVIFGGISEIGARPYGSLTYALTGSDDAIDDALASLRASGGDDLVEEHNLEGLR